jgi:hypothetical protein
MELNGSNTRAKTESVRTARAIVSGELGILEGCIRLASLAHDLILDWRIDADFVVFGAVASEVDNLPLGAVRSRWNLEALARADLAIERYTQVVKEQVLAACRNVISRFGTDEAGSSHV